MRPADNPFEGISADALSDIYEWPRAALEFVDGHVDCLHIIGDCGMGKTTLLRQIQRRLTTEGEHVSYTCVPLEGVVTDSDLGADVVLLDETDRFDKPTLQVILSVLWDGGRRAVLAGHKDQRKAIRKAGFSPAFLRLHPVRSAARLASILTERVSTALGRPDHPYHLTPAAVKMLGRHARGNIERSLQIGYEVFEDLEAPRAIEASDIEAAAEHLDRATLPVEG